MVRGIKFVGIPTRDQDVALKFYTEALGLKVVTDQPFTEKQRWIELLIPGAETGLALYTPEGHEKRIGEFQSIAFWCDDVFATAKVLKSKGVPSSKTPQERAMGRNCHFQRSRRESIRAIQQGQSQMMTSVAHKFGLNPDRCDHDGYSEYAPYPLQDPHATARFFPHAEN
jgi:catechol 2,3-dioxygenase-like lactoylglutathione lyase family enzyme